MCSSFALNTNVAHKSHAYLQRILQASYSTRFCLISCFAQSVIIIILTEREMSTEEVVSVFTSAGGWRLMSTPFIVVKCEHSGLSFRNSITARIRFILFYLHLSAIIFNVLACWRTVLRPSFDVEILRLSKIVV